jgi:hypothetical protein
MEILPAVGEFKRFKSFFAPAPSLCYLFTMKKNFHVREKEGGK